jgi:uncharacterized membrane protein
MTLEDNTSFVLRYGSMIGIAVVLAGVLSYFLDLADSGTIMTAGIAAIVFTPFAGMLVSFATLSMNKERKYAVSALLLIAVTVIGMLAAFCLR